MSESDKEQMSVEERLHRLRLLFGKEDASQISHHPFVPFMIPQQALEQMDYSTDLEDDEKVLLDYDRVERASQQPVQSEPTAAYDPCMPDTEGEILKGEVFCPFKALIDYPHYHLTLAERKTIEPRFFAATQLDKHPWEFFYIYPPADLAHNPILLVSLSQVEVFLSLINSKLGTELKIPKNAARTGFIVEFILGVRPYPTYIGRLTVRESAEIAKMGIPSVSYSLHNDSKHSDAAMELALDAFRKKTLLLLKIERQEKHFNKDKKKLARCQKMQSWNHTIKRIQQYLGIRETHRCPKEASWNYQQGSELQCSDSDNAFTNAAIKSTSQSEYDSSVLAPFVQEDSVIFISVDVEAYERAHHLVTEIGIATLDTVDIMNILPGERAKNWFAAIRARHFRIKENGHRVNKDFVQGCPDKFLFGSSEWVSIKDAPHEVANCFKHPFSSSNTEPDVSLPKRNIVFVGHNVKADVKFLRQIGYDPRNLSNLQELVDTASMYQAFSRDTNPRGLGSILASLNIEGWHLHNAGNDAVYTLQAMLAISVQALLSKLERKAMARDMGDGIGEGSKENSKNDWASEQGWSSADKGSSGGDAVLEAHSPKKGKSQVSMRTPSRRYNTKADALNNSWRTGQNEAPKPLNREINWDMDKKRT